MNDIFFEESFQNAKLTFSTKARVAVKHPSAMKGGALNKSSTLTAERTIVAFRCRSPLTLRTNDSFYSGWPCDVREERSQKMMPEAHNWTNVAKLAERFAYGVGFSQFIFRKIVVPHQLSCYFPRERIRIENICLAKQGPWPKALNAV